MRVQYPKLYNMTHLLALNVLLLPKDLTIIFIYDGPDIKLFILVGWGRDFLSVAWPNGIQLVFFFCSGFRSYSAHRDLHRRVACSISWVLVFDSSGWLS